MMIRAQNENERAGRNPYVMSESCMKPTLQSNAWEDIRGQMILTAQIIDCYGVFRFCTWGGRQELRSIIGYTGITRT